MKHYASSQPTFESIYSDFLNCNGRIMVIAHRGDWKQAPENSLTAIDFSIQAGVDMIEFDLKKTKDGVPYSVTMKQLIVRAMVPAGLTNSHLQKYARFASNKVVLVQPLKQIQDIRYFIV